MSCRAITTVIHQIPEPYQPESDRVAGDFADLAEDPPCSADILVDVIFPAESERLLCRIQCFFIPAEPKQCFGMIVIGIWKTPGATAASQLNGSLQVSFGCSIIL